MTTTNAAKITNAAMMTAYVEFAKNEAEAFEVFCDMNGMVASEVLAKAEKHLETLSKPRAKSTSPSKAQLANMALLRNMLPNMTEPMRANDICNTFGLSSVQKATGLMRFAISQGLVEKTIVDGVALFKAL